MSCFVASSLSVFILPFLSSMNAFPFHRVDFHLLVTVFAGWNHSLAFYPYFRSLFSFIPSLPYDSPLLSPLFAQ